MAKIIKSLHTQDNYKMYLNLIRSLKIPHKITRSNYTLKIESEFLNIHFTPRMDENAFKVSNMIKRDLKVCGMEMPDINKRELKYFNFAHEEILRRSEGKTIYNIDIKSAYASNLMANKIIAKDTYNYMSTLSKKNRLAAVGMLAAKKEVLCYDDSGICISHDRIVKPTENWFYWCVQETQNLMLDIKDITGHDFLFYWVDGIFFNNKDHTQKIANYLFNKGYRYSFDVCEDFKFSEVNGYRELSYSKEGGRKILNMPAVNYDANNFLLKFLNLIK